MVNPPPITSARWGGRTKRIVALIMLVLTVFVLLNLWAIIPLLVVATLLSYLLYPLVNFIEQRLLFFLPFRSRVLAVILAFVIIIAVVVNIFILIVPVLVDQFVEVGQNLPVFLADFEMRLQDFLNQPIMFNGRPVLVNGEPIIPLERIQDLIGSQNGLFNLDDFDFMQFLQSFGGSIGGLTGPAFNVLGGAINAVVNMTFLLVIMFYLMRDGERFVQHTINIIPESYQGDVQRLLYELGRVWNAYLRGQLLLCVAVGVATYVAALVLGLPAAPVLAVIAGIFEFIPNLGPFLAAVPAVFIALLSQSTTFPFLSGLGFALAVILTWTLIQQLEAIYLVPRVMGGSLDLHPVVVIIAVIAGANVAGALGLILAAPMVASMRVFAVYIYGKLLDVDPFPPPKPQSETQPLIIRLYQRVTRIRFVYPIRRKES
ncbi:MAG: AI-2E family transporter [Phototrophicales bacterium]|nr:MAG: AI-2E family transporter [Chloroflexota bacterium]